jgi:hypothetical protein
MAHRHRVQRAHGGRTFYAGGGSEAAKAVNEKHGFKKGGKISAGRATGGRAKGRADFARGGRAGYAGGGKAPESSAHKGFGGSGGFAGPDNSRLGKMSGAEKKYAKGGKVRRMAEGGCPPGKKREKRDKREETEEEGEGDEGEEEGYARGGRPLERLRHHVTGAIERGEKEPIREIPARSDAVGGWREDAGEPQKRGGGIHEHKGGMHYVGGKGRTKRKARGGHTDVYITKGGKHEWTDEDNRRAEGGRNWIKGAIEHKGALHKSLGIPEGETIPEKKLTKAAHSDNPKTARRAKLAETLKGLH